MRKTRLALVISSVLLGAVAAQAEPTMEQTQPQSTQTTSPTDTRQPAEVSTSRETTPRTDNNDSVGTKESNVDEKSTSGSYYPYSAGTVGDDPAEPTSTSPTAATGGDPTQPTDQWMRGDSNGDGALSRDELAKLSPSLASSFAAMDVDKDGKLTRGEFRTWHESHKARMDADQPATSGTNGRGGNWSGTTAPTSTAVPATRTVPAGSTAPSDNNTASPDSTTGPASNDTADDKGN